eukprot:TRINITY_DN6220_c0_g1_i25.p1 TRINITY_DN6220_c0_g1~~TRINITY_DN6220_c0_g1_i25.p1  ORF type:complete len:440 (+),score=112.64 TRINITY_DN6220_c0_g1_i25:112-1320(+)
MQELVGKIMQSKGAEEKKEEAKETPETKGEGSATVKSAIAHGIMSIIKSNQVTKEDFRQMTIQVFGILLSALLLWLIYFNYIMFGDFFSGAFLAIIISIPLEHKKQEMLKEFYNRITKEPILKSTKNAILFQFVYGCTSSMHYLTKSSGASFKEKFCTMASNIKDGTKKFVERLLGDFLLLTIVVIIYISSRRNSALTTLLLIVGFLIADILLGVTVDGFYYLMRIVHNNIFALFDKSRQPTPSLTSAISITLVVMTVAIILTVVAVLIVFLTLQMAEVKELGSYLYGVVDDWVQSSNITYYLFNKNERVTEAIRGLAVEYGETLKTKLSVDTNLTALVNGTSEEMYDEIVRDISLLINNTFAVNTSEIYNSYRTATPDGFSIMNVVPLLHAHLSSVCVCVK